MLTEANQFFKLLSDSTRLRCLLLLQQHGELCVCELVYALDLIQPKISRHLAALRDAGVVTDRRSGQWIYYQIDPELDAWARQVIDTTAKEAASSKLYANDLAALARMPNRPDAARCA